MFIKRFKLYLSQLLKFRNNLSLYFVKILKVGKMNSQHFFQVFILFSIHLNLYTSQLALNPRKY